MANSITVNKTWVEKGSGILNALCTVTLSGSYAAGGEQLSFAGKVPTSKYATPYFGNILSCGIGYVGHFIASSRKIVFHELAATSGEVAAGAYPAGLSGTTVQILVAFPVV